MTSQDQDTERKWAGPIEEVGAAIEAEGHKWLRNAVATRVDKTQWLGWVDVPNEVFASAAISTFISHGWVNPQFMDALKAEKAEASTPGKARKS